MPFAAFTAKTRFLAATSCVALLTGVAGQSFAAEAGSVQTADADAAQTAATPAPAADAGDTALSNSRAIEEILVYGSGMAIDLAPIKSSLGATQPVSIVTRAYIEEAIPQTADFSPIAQIAPSVSGTNKNGPGFAESKTVLRGFQDGEYNMTYDGIPFGDTNNPTHHSTSFFPGSTIGAMAVDRGPGNAGQLGQANFGGSINMFSLDMGDEASASQSATVASFDSYNLVTTLRSGAMDSVGGVKVLVNLQELNTDGYLTHSYNKAQNQTLKIQIPVSDNVKVTLFGSHNTIRYFQTDTDGITLNQAAQFGKNFALSDDPRSATYFGYNVTHKETDFEYIRIQADLTDDVYVDNTSYTYFYQNDTLSALQANYAGQTALGTRAGPAGNRNVPGYSKNNEYRVWGNILRGGKKFAFGELRAGIWYERASTKRYRFDYDFTQAPPLTTPTAQLVKDNRERTAPLNINYLQHSGWNNVQPFVDFQFEPVDGLTVTPGFKYVSFERFTNAVVQQTSRVPFNGSGTFTKPLEFVTANYRVREDWSVYAQFAKGFLVPDLNVFYQPNPNTRALKPQTSTNYQVGTVFNADKFTFDGDVYYIDFNDKTSSTVVNGETVFTNLGGAIYKGVEAQGTYAFQEGIAVFANGSVNSAKTKDTHKTIAKAPLWTAAAGVILKYGSAGASLVDKIVGPQWSIAGEPAAYKMSSYNTTDLTVTYDFPHVRLIGGVYNLFNSTKITSLNAQGGTPAFDQYYFQGGRSFQLTAKVTF